MHLERRRHTVSQSFQAGCALDVAVRAFENDYRTTYIWNAFGMLLSDAYYHPTSIQK